MTCSSFKQGAWNDKVVETTAFRIFLQEAWNDKVEETMTLAVSDRKPVMVSLCSQ